MRIKFAPKSNLGKWSIGLIIMVPILFYTGMSSVNFYKTVPAGKTIPRDLVVRPGMALSMLTGFGSGIAAFFCGMVGITRKKDYSVLVFISTIMGFFVLAWVFVEILFPH